MTIVRARRSITLDRDREPASIRMPRMITLDQRPNAARALTAEHERKPCARSRSIRMLAHGPAPDRRAAIARQTCFDRRLFETVVGRSSFGARTPFVVRLGRAATTVENGFGGGAPENRETPRGSVPCRTPDPAESQLG
jgi:hypothetical protein